MSENLVETVQKMLKEETWTRATISNYTQNNLKELAVVVEKADDEKCIDELYNLCSEHLSHAKDSIIALYVTGILSLKKGSVDNSSLIELVDIFQKNHKEQIVKYLCESIRNDYPNNKFALRTLAELYAAENNPELWNLYVEIVRIDFSEADIAKLLAEHYEAEGDQESAEEYYKKAILRYVNAGNFNAIKEIWSKLVQLIPEQFDFFQLVRRKIAKSLGEIRTTTLMQELFEYYKEVQNWDIAIEILKQNLEIEPKDSWARKALAECYRGKYSYHSHLEEYIKSSNLTQNYRNVFEAINDFEKHIAFDKGSFVFHRTWGVGIIMKLEQDTLYINFGKQNGKHKLSLKMAVSALKPLSKDHIWVLKATKTREELAKMVKEDRVWALKTIIKSYDNNCDFKKIKAELVPAILTPGEWTAWNTAAKKILEEDTTFGVNPNDISMYTVRDHDITPEEKLSNEFKAQKQFFARIDIFMKFFNSDDTDKTSELFDEMYSYFTGFLKNISKVNEQVIASYLIIRKLAASDNGRHFDFTIRETFAELYERLDDPRETYVALKDSKNTTLREDFLASIRMLPNWNAEYIKLFPSVLNHKMISLLINKGFTEDVQKLARTSFESFKDFRETVIFFVKECQDEDWFKEAGISYEKQLITLVNIIELTFREINNHVNSTENKKINKNAYAILSEPKAFSYMFESDEATVRKMYTLIDDISDFDSTFKSKARNTILEKYPDFKFRVSEESNSQPKGMFVTNEKLTEKKAELERLQNEELPANAKEIADAKEKGDLKENAEYKSAKEKQHMLTLKLATLQAELARAVRFDPTTVTTAIVSFGTVVTLTNNANGCEEKFTMLGPWESDPENSVISYLSPFGNALMDKKVGDKAVFTINEHNYNYTVKNIEKASIARN